MRKDEVAGSRGDWHTSEKKRKETTCAEGRGRRIERSSAHVKEEKKRRVRRDEVADERGGSYLPRKKKARSSQEKQEKGRNI